MKTPREVLLSVEDNIDHPAHDIGQRLVDKALAALDAEGWAIVPKVPTPKMREVGMTLMPVDSAVEASELAKEFWLAMVSAAR